MKKIRKRNKRKYATLLRQSKAANLYLSDYVSLIRQVGEIKRFGRLRKKHGEVIAWDKIESLCDIFITVPIYVRSELTGHRVIFEEDDVPVQYRDRYLELKQSCDEKRANIKNEHDE